MNREQELANKIFEELEELFRERDMPITVMAVVATEKYAKFKEKYTGSKERQNNDDNT